jgi:DNA-binding NarL/FixJ family response regulator
VKQVLGGFAVLTTLIVDDESDVRALIRAVVETADDGLEVMGEAADGDEALVLWRAGRPGVVILDNRMPGIPGLELAERMLAEDADQKIILFSAHLEGNVVAQAYRIGVRRCLDKTDISRLPEALWGLADSA